MQQVNDDMEDLFRRAAENYPLNTGNADWNTMAKKLADQSNATDIEQKKKEKKRFLWLLLLIPFILFYYNYYFHAGEKISATSKNVPVKNADVAPNSKIIDPATANTATTIVLAPVNSSVRNNVSQLNNMSHANTYNRVLSESCDNKVNQSADRSTAARKITDLSESSTSIKKDEKTIKQDELVSESIAEINNKNDEIRIANKLSIKNLSGNADNKKQEDISVKTINQENKTLPPTNNDTPSIKKSQKKVVKQKQYGLYAGLIVSPDVSSVKFQSVKKLGLNFGVVAGYNFKNFGIESGVLWDQKHYYTDGKYFNTKNITLRPYTNINNADGVCYMIEVPLAVNYFISKRLSTSAGFSSYFMKKEKYNYSIATASGGQYPYSTTYNQSSSNLFATINVGAAYNYALNRNTNIIIQPYAKFPLKEIGIGSLPIMSTGLNIGITTNLSR